jgi:hypothetical protein
MKKFILLICFLSSVTTTGLQAAVTSAANGCKEGFFCKDGEQTQCPVGTFCIPGAEKPMQCAEGFLCPGGTTSQMPCESGYTCSWTRREARCSAGSACLDGVAITCPAGTYSENGVDYCERCPKGTYSSTVGANSAETCTACGSNKWCPTEGLYMYLACPYGHRCPGGQFADAETVIPIACAPDKETYHGYLGDYVQNGQMSHFPYANVGQEDDIYCQTHEQIDNVLKDIDKDTRELMNSPNSSSKGRGFKAYMEISVCDSWPGSIYDASRQGGSIPEDRCSPP